MARRGRHGRAVRGEESLQASVLRFLSEHPTRGFKAKELQRALRIPHSRYREFRSLLVEMAREQKIAALPRRRFAAMSAATRLEGTVEGVGSFPTRVRLSDDSVVPLSPRAVEAVVCGDRVRIRKTREDGELRAAIDRLVLAAPREVFGILTRIGGRWVLEPEPSIPSLRGGIFLTQDLDASCEGKVARGEIPAFEPSTQRPELPQVEVLGAADHPRAAMLGRIISSGWPRAFSAEAESIAREGNGDGIARLDLEAERIFTIDPADAKDHDDAVSIVVRPDGGWALGVFIADVAARVPTGSALDDEARARCTSVYPPGTVLPMLPEVLSAGACSLHHGAGRDVIGLRLHYAPDGRRERVELGLARITSRASLAYEEAEALLATSDATQAAVPSERLAADAQLEVLRGDLGGMLELASRLRARRRDRGSLFVERPEREFVFGEDGHVAELRLRPQLRSHWIIEEFMLEANRAVAEVLQRAGLPLLWRIHEDPDNQKIDTLCEVLEQLRVGWAPHSPVRGEDFAELFARVADAEFAPLVHLLSLRSLMKARYSRAWRGHFGLAFERYTHFTSPIRRYPDLHNQRQIHLLLEECAAGPWLQNALESADVPARARRRTDAEAGATERLADLCSELERRAQILERQCADICAADALKPREGEFLEGMIVTVLPSGLFVELEGTGLDGFVGVERLGREWFHYDARRQAQVGERTGRSFRLGQRVRVLLEYVDVRQGRLWLDQLESIRRERSPQGRNRA